MAEVITVRAYSKGIAQAPRKIGLVTGLVRGRTVADALVILDHTPRRAALPVKKAIESAQANAINNYGLDTKSLVISTISATAGTRMRRFIPASRGRALPYEKVSTNLLVEVSGTEKPKKKPVAKKAAPKAEEVKEEAK